MVGYDKNKFNNNRKNRINNQIKISPILVIGEDGVKIGVITTSEALRIAAERELDLVEVSPEARPPVCRLMDYSKFRYEQSVKDKKSKKQKSDTCKEIRLRPNIGDHDLQIKINSIKKFIEDSLKVQLNLRYKSREAAHKDLGFKLVEKIIAATAEYAVVKNPPKLAGNSLVCIIEPKECK